MGRHIDGIPIGDSRYFLVRAVTADGTEVLNDVRNEDREEWWASEIGGLSHLPRCIDNAYEAWSIVDWDGMPHIIWGVSPGPCSYPPEGREDPDWHNKARHTTWLLGTNQGQKDCAWIWQECRPWIDAFFKRWPRTECWSDCRQTLHHKWLEWVGYRLQGVVPYGPYLLPFRHYIKEPQDV